jgi:poly(beta-D-mannuronate) lyase
LVLGNTIESSQGTITLRQGSNNRVEGNFILGNGRSMTGGIRVTGPGHIVVNNYIADIDPDEIPVRGAIVLHGGDYNDPIAKYPPIRDALVANNTIVNAGRSIVVGEATDAVMPEDVVVANNIVWGASGPLIVDASELVNPKFLNNILFGASGGLAADAGQILLDPRLKPDAAGLWRPAADSPARRAGAPIPNVTVDILQRERIEPYDIGAFNVSTTSGPISRPLGRCDVGPMTFDPDDSGCIGATRPKPPQQLTRQ